MLNRVVLMGRLTADPDLRSTKTGTPVASFTLAVDRDFKDQNGQREADFVPCVAWRSTANFAAKYFVKGQMACVEGRLQLRDWQADDGTKRRTAEVIVDSLYYAGSRPEGRQAAPAAASYGQEPTGFRDLSNEEQEGALPF